jgi:hypothetical protein
LSYFDHTVWTSSQQINHFSSGVSPIGMFSSFNHAVK